MAPLLPLQQNERIGQFRGDGEGLVDRLIKACEQSNAKPSSFGRELVPWTDESALNVTLEALETRARPTSSVLPRPCKGGIRATPGHKSLKFNKDQSEAAGCSRSGAPRTRGPAGTRRASSSIGYACPALAAAPKPCDLPMPTSALMNRAGVRSRSPSPPSKGGNSFSFCQVQRLVRVAA